MNGFQSALAPCGLPLQVVCPLPAHPFLSQIDLCSPPDHPDVLLLQGHFDLAQFSHALFSLYELPVPTQLANAVNKRRAEYLASRVCVRYALAHLGINCFILANGADRAPIWPADFVGSLSHTQQRISLLLARADRHKLLGTDCELIMKHETAEEMQTMILNARELSLLRESGLSFATALTVAFSLKESLYKALFPQLRCFMNFDAAEIISCTAQAESVTLRLGQTFSERFPAGREFVGRVVLNESELLSWIIARR